MLILDFKGATLDEFMPIVISYGILRLEQNKKINK